MERLWSLSSLTIDQSVSIVSMAVGIVFAYSAASKVVDMPSLAAGIGGYRLFPNQFAPVVAALLVITEGIIALGHLTNTATPFVASGTIILLIIFFLFTARSLRDNESPPCLCFGASSGDAVGLSTLVRISLLIGVEVALLCTTVDGASSAIRIEGALSIIETFIVAAFFVTLIGWCFALPKLFRAMHVIRT